MSKVLRDIMTLSPVIPVITIDDARDAVPLAQALAAGGMPIAEITLRTKAGLEAIALIHGAMPDFAVGAGTVLSPQQYEACVAAGAAFIVSPGMTPSLMAHGAKSSVPLLPGIASASELMQGLELGYDSFKFFPAEAAGGTAMLKALAGPFPDIRFCPTGGISLESAGSYLSLSNVLCVGGSWIASAKEIAAKNWDKISETAAASVKALG